MAKNIFQDLTVLIVDDESMMRVLLKGLLHQIGFEKILEAEDGGDALRRLEESQQIDIVICDLEMPLIGGLELVGMLRGSKAVFNPNVPVIIVTGHSEQGNVHEAVRLGIHGFLVKPVSHTKLEAQIVRALRRPTIKPASFAVKKRGVSDVEVLDFNKKK